jgi:hypothetical protein
MAIDLSQHTTATIRVPPNGHPYLESRQNVTSFVIDSFSNNIGL